MTAAEQLIQEGLEKGIERGVEQGRTEGLRAAIAAVLSARGLTCGKASQAKLAACSDGSILMHWLTRATSAASEADVFAPFDAGR